ANPAAIAAARQAAGQPEPSSTSAGGYSDVPYRAPGPHETDTANRLDPNVDPTAYSAARAAPGAAARDEQPSHLGRDIGLAGAGAAAAGGAAYAAERGHDRSQGQGRFDNDSSAGVPQGNTGNTGTTGTTGTGTGIDTGPAPNTIGPHKSDALNVLDPRVQPQPELMKGNSSSQPQAERQDAREGERGYGREAAAAGGVGAAALGAGALASHEREKAPTSSTTGASSTAPLGSTSSTAPTGSTSSNAPFGATTSSADRPAAADRTRTGSYQDSGPLSDRRQDTGEKWRGWQNPYSTAAVDPRLDDMPGAFPETPGEQLDRAPEQQQRGSGLGAAAGAGALGAGAGAGAYEASKLGRVDETREPTGSAAVQNTPRTPERQQDVGMAMTTNEAVPSPTHREFTRGPEYGAVPRVEDDEIDRQHHYGRDALVAGGVGAAGVGTYEAAKHLEQSKEGPLSTKDIYGEEAVKPKPVQQQTAAGTQSASTSSSKPIFGEFETKTRDAAPLASTGQKPIYGDFAEKSATGAEDTGKDHHYGRDAAVAGGAGAAGLAGYEATKDHGKAPTSNREIYGDEAVKPKPVAGAEQTGKDHHYGRDAALAGGAGAAGLAGYEATKDHGKAPTSTREIYGDEAITPKPVAGAEQAGKEHHYGRDAALAGGAGAAGLAGYEATKDHSSKAPTSNREIYGQDAVTPKPVAGAEQTGKEHHYGRDAALAGGAGAAGVGAYEASKHAGSSRAPTSNREIYGEDAVKPRPVQQGATGASDANTSEHHYGRDAALAGGAGAAGVGAYEASKHAGSSRAPTSNREIYGEDAVKPQPVQQGAPGAGPTGASATSATGQHHYGRDAALAGGAGAAGLGAYEASKHAGSSQPTLGQPTAGQAQQSSPAPHLRAAHNIYPPEVFQSHHQQPTSAATAGGLTGDSATGEAQRGQQQAQDHHYGRDAALAGSAAGLAGAGAYAATRDHPDQGYQTSSQNSKAYQHAPLQSTGQPAVGETQRGQQPPQEHHYGRDAALAGGATGLVGAGAYAATRDTPQQGYQTASENSKAFQHAPPLAQSQQSGQTAPFEQPRQAPPPPTQHHYGRDAGLAGGAAGGATAAGIGAHDYAQAPTAALRDPVAALQDAVSHGYDDQRAAPHMGGQQHFDPVRGGTLDEDGVSHPHKHAHPAYRPDQPQGQDHRDQDIAMTGAAGAGLTGAAFASQHGHHEGAAQEKFDPMNPTGTQHTGPFHKHKHTPSATSSKYSEENAPDSPSSGKRKHKILTFLNKKDDKDASPRSSLDKDHGNREVYSTRDPAAAERQQGFVGQEQYPPQQQQQALHGLGGPEGHEFGGLDQREGEGSALQGSTGSLGRGHSKLHKEPPKKWVQEHMGGQQGKVSDTPPRID
ncbi:MAG: hypothetical protein INR71_01150, partial [Terriglobus roseus]|nr:hypothetical protein [Terriglobus roseus]